MGRSAGEPGDPAWAAGISRQQCPQVCPQLQPSTAHREHSTASATHNSLWLPQG